MEVVVKGKNFSLTEPLKEYVHKKLVRMVQKYKSSDVLEVKTELSVLKNRSVPDDQHVEVTLLVNGSVLKAQASAHDMYAAIDLVTDKVERHIRKHKSKTNDGSSVRTGPLPPLDEEKPSGPKIIWERFSQNETKPMTPEEAGEQLQVLECNFLIFQNPETEQRNLIYWRRDGNFGVIDLES